MTLKNIFCQVCCFLFFGSCGIIPPNKPNYPDKKLKEVITSGTYYSGSRELLEELKKELLENSKCEDDWIKKPCLHKGERVDDVIIRASSYTCEELIQEPCLYEGESIDEAINTRFAYLLEEEFRYHYSKYCYNKKSASEKSFTRNDLVVRIYDKSHKIVLEKKLPLKKIDRDSFYSRSVYDVEIRLPYYKNTYHLIIRLEGDKEIILSGNREYLEPTQDYLQEISEVQNFGYDWTYKEEEECHLSPPVR